MAAEPAERMMGVVVADSVATLTLSRPPVNAVSEEWLRQFNDALDGLATRSDWNVLHLRSDQKVFCAGADLKEMRERFAAPDGPDRTYAYVADIQRLYNRIERLPQATLCEIGGAAMGGGLELALACDLRIAATRAKLGLPEVQLGLIPGAGGTQRLSRLCGRAIATRLILGAEVIDGAEARELGIVQWTALSSELHERAAEIARRIATLPTLALSLSKTCIAAASQPGPGGYSEELEATRWLLMNSDTRQRVEAFFASSIDGANLKGKERHDAS
jgi:enoyl-CoA hydratase/carnithine racemase